MDEEKLTCLVSLHECLFNVSNRTYSDKVVKMNAWEKISEEMGKPVSDCQKHWKSIRDNLRKAVNLRKYKSGAAGGKHRPIKYERQLEFLKPHLQHRQQTSNLDSSPEEDTQTSDTLSLDNDNNSPRPSSQMSSYSYSQPKENRGRASDILEKYLLSKESEDPVDIFFKTMASTVKKLPEQMQAEIKKDVFKIVNDAELKFYAKHDINRTLPFDESRSSIENPTTVYTVDNTKDTTYVPTRVTRNTTPQYTYTPSSVAPSTSFQFQESPPVEFIAKSYTTKNITTNTDNPTMQSYYTSLDTSNSYLLKQTNYSTEDSDNAHNFE